VANTAGAIVPRYQQRYQKEIVKGLMEQLSIKNVMAVPKLVKIVVNMGCGEAAHDAKILESAQKELAMITGQRPVVTRAKKAVSNFKIKEGDPVGCKVTLRRVMMYEFMERLLTVALPRIRDFRGLSLKGFDHGGNYSFGIKEQTIFPELRLDEVTTPLGMDITFVTTAGTPERAKALMTAFGLPFEKPSAQAQGS
jgi:large subunit ribosomal protein L5